MSIKQSPNHQQYLTILNKMSAEQRFPKALELSALTKDEANVTTETINKIIDTSE